MSWIKGEIVEFPGNRPEHRELGKIRTEPGQKPDDMFFFRLEWARRKGYPDSELAVGKTIEFEPMAGSDRPRVGRFKPYSGSGGARAGAGGHAAAGAREAVRSGGGGREGAGAAASRGQGEDASPFLNPYHFIPLVAPAESSLADANDLLREGTLHDRFLLPGAEDGGVLHYSGRVVCRLETEGPMVVGAEQRRPHAESPTEVEPFELPRAGATPGAVEMRPAIPGSSLRGLISAIVEAASCSAMRVLPEREFTRRVAIDGGKSVRRLISGSLHDSISRLHHPDLVPFHPARTRITLAERLFGFAEADGQRALAGRLRFSHALVAGEPPEGGWYLPRKLLEILASPKPPSPAFYFGQQGYIAKRDLDLTRHAPHGRKVYLHHREQDVEACRYESREDEASPEARRKAKLKMSVTLLRRGVAFYFHVDFQNLSGEELGHLLYALRPTAEFRHKLGLGKPLGLGRVRIDPVALCFIDRDACYRPAGCWAAKYAGRGLEIDSDERREWAALTGDLAERYRHEMEVSTLPAIAGGSWPRLDELSAMVRAQIHPTVRWALELVGDPASAEHTRVTYPVTVRPGKAGEHFRWFVNNDRSGGQHLKAIEKDQPLLPLTPNRE
jgi:hypothetical protein